MSVLLEQGRSQSALARLLGVSEGTVRYHRKLMKLAVVDGRKKQMRKAAAFADVIEAWRLQQVGGWINLAVLHEYSTRIWPAVPRGLGHLFHEHLATCSTALGHAGVRGL